MLQAKRERIVVVSHSTKCLDVIQKTLDDRGFENVRLEGSTSTSKRVQMVDRLVHYSFLFFFGSRHLSNLWRFQSQRHFVFLLNVYVALGIANVDVSTRLEQNAQSQVQRPEVQIVCDAA